MRVLAIIPARAQSQRLPGKPLAMIGSTSVVERVWNQCQKATCFTDVFIATDSQEIADAVQKFGGNVLLTRSDHQTGTDRVAEALTIQQAAGNEYDLIANVQGDLPFIGPAAIDAAVNALAGATPEFGMSTVAVPIYDVETFQSPNSVKIALGEDNRALYFSRAAIPYPRKQSDGEEPLSYHHFGLYVFRPAALLRIAELKQTGCEKREQLEQLRALAHGIGITVAIVTAEELGVQIEINTFEDLEAANRAVQTGGES